MKGCLCLLFVVFAITVSLVSGDEAQCTAAISSCSTSQSSAFSASTCSEQKPYFDCLLAGGCTTDLTAYKAEVTNKSYDDCNVCTWAADIFMVVDASGSIGYTHFQTLKNSVEVFQDNMGVSDIGVRIGIVMFSSSIYEPITPLTGNASFLRSEIRGLPYIGGGTNTHLGIDRAEKELNNTGRSTHRIMAVLTDGKPNNPTATKQSSINAAAQGIAIYAIGIGQNIRQSGLEDIASDPSRVIQSLSFDVLADSLRNLSQSICGSVVPIDEAQCITTIDSCATSQANALAALTCSEQKPYFDCLLAGNCTTDLIVYQTQVKTLSYDAACNGNGTGNGSLVPGQEAQCTETISSCSTSQTSALQASTCNEQKPYFDCLLAGNCTTDLTAYKTQVTALSYADCTGNDNGAAMVLMNSLTFVLLFIFYNLL